MTQLPRIPALCAVLAAALGSGCVSFGLSQSAQTLGEGQVQHQFGLEWFRLSTGGGDYKLPFAMPYYGMRAGMAEGVDFGFRTNVTFTNVGFDLKLQPLDTEALDVSIDPTLQYAWIWGFGHLPLLVGFNVSDAFQITLSGRIAYAFPLIDDSDPSDLEDYWGAGSQAAAGGGLGLYVRLGSRFAILPEVQAIRGFGDTDPVLISFTLGFAFGDQPGVAPAPEPPPIPPTQVGPPPAGGYYPVQSPPPYPGPYLPPGPAEPRLPSEPPPGAAPATPPGYGSDEQPAETAPEGADDETEAGGGAPDAGPALGDPQPSQEPPTP